VLQQQVGTLDKNEAVAARLSTQQSTGKLQLLEEPEELLKGTAIMAFILLHFALQGLQNLKKTPQS